ncbi:disintegrin and metalloproteinase domain-containing protein 20-like [Trachemys scripta elegans]|uniref:disintegrin and metalloproteinase domain-containing protein 20-like n=1 Tax=Trachemys scripta elegans TaxID=31138 RepID=UPI00155550F4|nr:disintegrin and metalloproteinase domain-containing protein 20-like [Trachemys scripta elegans]
MGLQVWALLLLLSPGFSDTLKFSYSEVIVPRKLEPRDGIDTKEKVSYLIKVEGKLHIVHLLQKKMFIAPNIPVFTYNEKGDLITDYPYIQDDCYYSGYVEDVPESVAVLSTCSGLWGHLMISDLNYEIKPVKSSSTFQHIIYRMAADEDSPGRCGVTDEDMKDQAAKGRDHQISKVQMERQLVVDKHELNTLYTSTRYLECYFVADTAKFRLEDSNQTLLTLKMLQYIHFTSEMYRPFGLHVVLIGLELWTERDLFTITRLLDDVLLFYSDYVRNSLMGRVQFDHAELIVGGRYRGAVGYSYGDLLCTRTPSVAVVNAKDISVLYDAILVSHEMGHSLGFPHDDDKTNTARGCVCKCPGGGNCIMWSYTPTIICKEFSNCSRADYFNMIRKPGKTCLLNIPEKKIFGTQMCGNGVIEDREECDCGMDEVCLRSGCCLPNCVIKPGAACISGLCCKNCQLHRQGEICRKSIGECDLPEFCNGTSSWCPEDVFKQDGTPCGDNDCCFQGRCRNHERQCKAVFGKAAHRAPLNCFKAVNTKGDRCGNCGGDGLTYNKCQDKDVLCGRLQCVNVKKIPQMTSLGSIIQTPVDDILCWGTEFHAGRDMVDVGSVGDGTACGENKICINRTCVNITILNYDCNYSKCNNRGICNNKKNCHCNFGWAPPDCKLKGFGGSVSSGPPPPTNNLLPVYIQPEQQMLLTKKSVKKKSSIRSKK